jgi:anti-sigma-K factor RskA
MDTAPWLWLIITVGGAAVLGAALAYGLISTRKRRENPVAQRLTDAATKEVYRQEEIEREREETR